MKLTSIGINNSIKHIYICEVVTHLKTGMQYTKNKRPDTGTRLARKFVKDIEYGKTAFAGYEKTYELWFPVVKPSNGKDEYNQFCHLQYALDEVKKRTGIEVKPVINELTLKRSILCGELPIGIEGIKITKSGFYKRTLRNKQSKTTQKSEFNFL